MSTTMADAISKKSIPEPNTGCHLWLGTMLSGGYGQLKFGGKRYLAHRAAWESEHGPIPDGLEVRHFVCANAGCVNVRHLRLGTALDNARDRDADGHTARGEHVHGAKLDAAKVREIRAAWASGKVSVDDLSAVYGVSAQAAWAAAIGKTWRHL